MILFLISFVAGSLTILAPCVLPLLPIILGSTDGTNKKISYKSIRIIISLCISIIIFTALFKGTSLLVPVPESFWKIFSGTVLILLGLATIFPNIWYKMPLIGKINKISNRSLGMGVKQNNNLGDIIIGMSLGPVFTACSPTYLFILATILPSNLFTGIVYLFAFVLGLSIPLLLIAYFGQQIIQKINYNNQNADMLKKLFGVIFVLLGIAIITGIDKKLEAIILDSGYAGVVNLDQKLLSQVKKDSDTITINQNTIPEYLKNSFTKTNWNKTTERVSELMSGGPGKDGIPALNNPKFVNINNWEFSEDIMSIVVSINNQVKVYPYNILNWHEIVNDTISDKNISVTFCPLCGTAIVYDRGILGEGNLLGVSGSLWESNMIMYDKDTESLWQQSTGESFAGDYLGKNLNRINFQFMTIKEAKKKYANALVLSSETGYTRNYTRNPYSGYEEDNDFIFEPSITNNKHKPKNIFLITNILGEYQAIENIKIEENKKYEFVVDNNKFTLRKQDGEIEIKNSLGQAQPFYFEMWFSFVVQHKNNGTEINLKEIK